MNQLKLGIRRNNHIFNIKLMPFYRFINYTSQYGDYELSIRFLSDKDKRPSVRYKNLIFTGAITSAKNWQIELIGENGRQSIVNMRNGQLRLRGESFQTTSTDIKGFSIPACECERTNNVQSSLIFQKCINTYTDLFGKINNKTVFQEQLVELIEDIYFDYETETELIENFKEYFVKFVNAENDCHQLSQIISIPDVLDRFPYLKTIKINDLNNFIKDSIETVATQYQNEIDIYYSRDIVISEIYNDILQEIEERNQIQFQKKYSNDKEIKKLLGDKLLHLKDLTPLLQRIHFLMLIHEITDKNNLLSKVDDLINQCKQFEKIWEDCAIFNHNKTIELTDEKLSIFESIDNGTNYIAEQDKQDYLVYKIAMPHYYSTLFNKKRTKLKPTIEKLTQYVDYVKNIVGVLLKNGLLIKKGEKLHFNSNINLANCKQEILSIERQI